VRNLLVDQTSFALTLVFGGAVLLLVLGTQILNWYWLALLFAIALGAGVYRGRKKVLTSYRVAQSIDAQLGLHDALSTAYFFGEHPSLAFASDDLIQRQREAAETVARSVDLRSGIPFALPRTLYINAALALAAFTMLGVRYGITRSMDLRASLIHIDFDGFLSSPRQVAEAKKHGKLPFEKDSPDGAAADPWDSKTSDLEPQPNTPMDTIEDTETANPDGSDPSAKSQSGGKDETPKGDDMLNSPDKKGDKSASDSDKPGEAKDSPGGDPQSGKQDNAQQNSDKGSNSGENSSLADKMKDAIANLMAKLKTQPKNTEGKQGGGSSSQPSQQSAQKQGQNKENQKGNPGEQQSENNANSQSQGDQQSQNGAQQSAQSQSEARNSDQTAKDGKSGIGKQDGDKTAREAAQQAAMGKISEIIGKRAANISGEVMVEVSSGKQQLKTQYSERDAKHIEAGGEINRDEVPLAYQQYVQQYFEEIRKEPAQKAKPADADSKAKSSGN
jgi:hypothetical protein